MKKTFILLSIVFMIVMAFASLSFANKISRNFNHMTTDPIITLGPPTPSVYGTTYRVTWSAPRCSNNQSPCVEGYEVMVDNKTKVVFRDNTIPLSNTFQLKVDTSTVNGSTCVPNVKHWIRVRAYNGNKERYSQNYIFQISNLNILKNTLTATVDDTKCVPEVHIEGIFIDEAHDTIQSAKIRVIDIKNYSTWNIFARREFPVPPTDIFPYNPILINQDNINTTMPLTGIAWTKSRIELVVRTTSGCQYIVNLGKALIPPTFSLIYNEDDSYCAVSECQKASFHFEGLIDNANCIDNATYVLRKGGDTISEGDVTLRKPPSLSSDFIQIYSVPMNMWYVDISDLTDVMAGDTYDLVITYNDYDGNPHNLICSKKVPNGPTQINTSYQSNFYICNGMLQTWGNNNSGQLGIGDFSHDIEANGEDQIKTVEHPDYGIWAQISTQYAATLALDCDGHLYAWGCTYDGHLGNNENSPYCFAEYDRLTPQKVLISSSYQFKFISMGWDASFAIQTDGHLWGWGNNLQGQVGSNTRGIIAIPEQVSNYSDWVYVSAGDHHALGIRDEGGIKSLWGWGQECFDIPEYCYQVLGNGSGTDNELTPTKINDTIGWKEVIARKINSAALTSSNQMYLCGDNTMGQIGNGSTNTIDNPIDTFTLLDTTSLVDNESNPFSYWTDFAVGYNHVLAIDAYGHLWGWGSNSDGQLGNISVGDAITRPIILNIGVGLENKKWKFVGAGEYHSIAEDVDGNVWVWGKNDYSQLAKDPISCVSSPQAFKITLTCD